MVDRRSEEQQTRALVPRRVEKLRFGSALPQGARTFAAVLGLMLVTATGAAAADDGDAQPGGAFTCDFGLSSGLAPAQIGPSIERDRSRHFAAFRINDGRVVAGLVKGEDTLGRGIVNDRVRIPPGETHLAELLQRLQVENG